tara:strand:- start:12557 stop:12943 length:387 start_codon:yes stop_codon:yes gene_type:complete
MSDGITLEQLQGIYEITYASSPQVEGFYEPGFGSAKIVRNNLTGVDALGVVWNAEFIILDNGTLSYKATLDPKDTPITVGLMDRSGSMSRKAQEYQGIMNVTKTNNYLILRTQVQQGPITINVQFRKK